MGNRNGRAPSGIAAANPNSNADPTSPGPRTSSTCTPGSSARPTSSLARSCTGCSTCAWTTGRSTTPTATPMPGQHRHARDRRAHVPDGQHRRSTASTPASPTRSGAILAFGVSHVDAHDAYPLARPADLRRRGADAHRALARQRHGRHRPGRRRRHQLQRQPGPDPRLPGPFDANGPDLLINAGAVVADLAHRQPVRDAPTCFDGRRPLQVRRRRALQLLPLRSGRAAASISVVPNSKDSDEDLLRRWPAAWCSRPTGRAARPSCCSTPSGSTARHTHPEYSAVTPSLPLPRLDDQLIALNVNMWW